MNLEDLKYPIGKPNIPKVINPEHIKTWIEVIENFPSELDYLTKNLSKSQLDTCYRDGGWTIRQVIHHCADSHHNSYTRFKWTLTEEAPIIKAYYEDRWAELFDSKFAPINLSINSLKALHAKWTYFLKGLTETDLEKYFIHPDGNEKVKLNENIGIYAWHCQHHYEHINQLLIRKKWK
ncbi:YfiT family bacillithiol transferase [Tenacibaculum sp. M341]|uniref:YfiT family bacillithiol transferase n=1 Tax=Tenacibaculum sp. M341 TaxID=2530339 RepID=UPI00104DE4E1|nr:putative metal-dependent hydrolase [Tenacibaculum sp. M341]TCI91129.1 putative metal-dependent hydrolase [Tenacibaculum sp. M341]